MGRHRLVFFEWAGSTLIQISNSGRLRDRTSLIVRLHSVELVTAAPQIDWRQVDRVIVVSEFMKESLLNSVNIIPEKIVVINNGVDLDTFTSPRERRFDYRIGMACRIHPIKRVYEAILTIWELQKNGYPFQLNIAGEFDDESNPRYPLAIQQIIKKLELEESVHLDGYVSDMPRWYRDCDIFLSNSYWEGQQVSLLEAMACGCFCLAHTWGGADEVLPGDCIFVSDVDLQRKLQIFADLEDRSKQKLQDQMRAIAIDRFNQERMVNEICYLINYFALPEA